jgi:hypothetical protein
MMGGLDANDRSDVIKHVRSASKGQRHAQWENFMLNDSFAAIEALNPGFRAPGSFSSATLSSLFSGC